MLRKQNRFRGSRSVQLTYRGKQARGRLFALRYRQRSGPGFRAVIVVSKKVSKSAVVRNRIRRRLYELLRTEFAATLDGYDYIVSAYDVSLASIPQTKIKQELQALLSKATTPRPTERKRAIVEREGK